MGLKLEHESESLGGLVKIQLFAGSTHRVSSSKSLVGPQNFISFNFPGDADAAIWDKLWELLFRKKTGIWKQIIWIQALYDLPLNLTWRFFFSNMGYKIVVRIKWTGVHESSLGTINIISYGFTNNTCCHPMSFPVLCHLYQTFSYQVHQAPRKKPKSRGPK